MKRTLATLAIAAGLLAGCHATNHAAPAAMVNIYGEEDLSGPAYAEPISSLVITTSAGWTCYANDRTGQDSTQYYTSCAVASRMGALPGIAPAPSPACRIAVNANGSADWFC